MVRLRMPGRDPLTKPPRAPPVHGRRTLYIYIYYFILATFPAGQADAGLFAKMVKGAGGARQKVHKV